MSGIRKQLQDLEKFFKKLKYVLKKNMRDKYINIYINMREGTSIQCNFAHPFTIQKGIPKNKK